MSKVKRIGIIAEDKSDFESSKVLIKRITQKDNIGFRKALGNGCGKLRRKASAYAVDLKNRGCDTLILIHDLDRHDYSKLLLELESKLKCSPIHNKFICIPIEELEAWFLADPEGIKKTFNLKSKPNIKGLPETIPSPKEKLGELIYHHSNKRTIYLNTKHNETLSLNLSIDLMKKKSNSFQEFYEFVVAQEF